MPLRSKKSRAASRRHRNIILVREGGVPAAPPQMTAFEIAQSKRSRQTRKKWATRVSRGTIGNFPNCPQPSSETHDPLSLSVCKEEVFPVRWEWSPSVTQKQPQPPQTQEEETLQRAEADGSTQTMPRRNRKSQAAVRRWQNWKILYGPTGRVSKDLLHLPECEEEAFSEQQQQRSSSLVQEEPEPPQMEDEEHLYYFLDLPLCKEEVWSSSQEPGPPQQCLKVTTIKEEQHGLLQRAEEADGATKSATERDGESIETEWSPPPSPAALSQDGGESRETTEPPAGTATERVKSLAYVSRWGATRLTTGDSRPLSSPRSDSDGRNRDEREETERCEAVHGAGQKFENASKGFDCKVCGKACKSKGNLKVHMATHYYAAGGRGEPSEKARKVLDCKLCGRTYKSEGYLKIHMATHAAGDVPFVCEVCGKGFIASRQFKEAHEAAHKAAHKAAHGTKSL